MIECRHAPYHVAVYLPPRLKTQVSYRKLALLPQCVHQGGACTHTRICLGIRQRETVHIPGHLPKKRERILRYGNYRTSYGFNGLIYNDSGGIVLPTTEHTLFRHGFKKSGRCQFLLYTVKHIYREKCGSFFNHFYTSGCKNS